MKTPISLGTSLLILSVSAHGATFQGLGLGPSAGAFQSQATSISADGTTVVGSSAITNNGDQAWRWNACTGMVRLDGTVGIWGSNDVSANGAIVVGDGPIGNGNSGNHAPFGAFRWAEAGGMTVVPVYLGHATRISDDGTLILGYGYFTNDNWQHQFQSAYMQSGTGPAVPFSVPDYLTLGGISRDNSIIVGGEYGAYRWTAATGAVLLPDLDPVDNPPDSSNAYDISADGKVISGTSIAADNTVHLVTWTRDSQGNNVVNDLGQIAPRDGLGASADSINQDGSVIVGEAVMTVGAQNIAYAFIWDATHGIRNLQDVLTDPNGYNLGAQLTGWHLDYAVGISDDGNVITGNGTYTDPNDPNQIHHNEAWVVSLYNAPTLTCGSSVATYNNAPRTVSLPLSGGPGIECRNSDGSGNSGNHTFVFGFTGPISSVDNVTSTCGTVVSNGVEPGNPDFYDVQVNTAACNGQYVTVTLTGVHYSSAQPQQRFAFALDQVLPSASVTAGLLVGDVNGDGVVNSADITLTKSHSGQVIDATNFRADLNADGAINSADITFVKSKSGTGLSSANSPNGPSPNRTKYQGRVERTRAGF